jgi:hypothetical protein
MRTQLRYPSRQADSAYGRARVPTSQTKRPPFHGKSSLAGDCFHHPAASLLRDRVGDGGVVPGAMTDECLSRLRSARAPSCPREAGTRTAGVEMPVVLQERVSEVGTRFATRIVGVFCCDRNGPTCQAVAIR